MFCSKCGKKLEWDEYFCKSCGKKRENKIQQSVPEIKTTSDKAFGYIGKLAMFVIFGLITGVIIALMGF